MRSPQSISVARRDTAQISWGKLSVLPRTPAGFTVMALDGYGLCDRLPARPTIPAWYPVSVRRVAILFHASFRRFLAVPPLRFTRVSPPSGYTGDFHPQDPGHAQHTAPQPHSGAPKAQGLTATRMVESHLVVTSGAPLPANPTPARPHQRHACGPLYPPESPTDSAEEPNFLTPNSGSTRIISAY